MEKLASNHHQMVYDRTTKKPMPKIHQMDESGQLLALITKIHSQEVQS